MQALTFRVQHVMLYLSSNQRQTLTQSLQLLKDYANTVSALTKYTRLQQILSAAKFFQLWFWWGWLPLKQVETLFWPHRLQTMN
jgi:hypothetical protein